MRLSDCSNSREVGMPAPGRRFGKISGAFAIGALLAAGLSGCGSMKPIKYYQLTHPPTSTLGNLPSPVDATLLVRSFQTSHLYREDRIVYGGEGGEEGVDEDDRWGEPPEEVLHDARAPGHRCSVAFYRATIIGDGN